MNKDEEKSAPKSMLDMTVRRGDLSFGLIVLVYTVTTTLMIGLINIFSDTLWVKVVITLVIYFLLGYLLFKCHLVNNWLIKKIPGARIDEDEVKLSNSATRVAICIFLVTLLSNTVPFFSCFDPSFRSTFYE